MPVYRHCPHCGTLTTGRCQPCRRERYGPEHQQLRARWEPIVQQGNTPCARGTWCGEPHLINPTEPWHLDHINGQRQPSCAHHNDQYTGR